MAMNDKWLLAPLLMLTSCALPRGYRVADHVTVQDDPANARFVLRYQNDTRRTICLSPDSWPNVAGNIPLTRPPDIWVSVGQQRFPLATFTEECPTCGVKVKRRSAVTGYLKYSAFKIPDALVKERKELHLPVAGGSCD